MRKIFYTKLNFPHFFLPIIWTRNTSTSVVCVHCTLSSWCSIFCEYFHFLFLSPSHFARHEKHRKTDFHISEVRSVRGKDSNSEKCRARCAVFWKILMFFHPTQIITIFLKCRSCCRLKIHFLSDKHHIYIFPNKKIIFPDDVRNRKTWIAKFNTTWFLSCLLISLFSVLKLESSANVRDTQQ